jgi:flagellar biosynthetic protein FliS
VTRTDLAYRKTAVEGASGFGLLIALFDTLAGNLQRAAEAERANEIETRSREVNHAFLVIGHLEDWVRRGAGGPLADQLIVFYANLRRSLIQAQIKRSAESLEQQMAEILKLRRSWQQADQGLSSEAEILTPGTISPLTIAAFQTETRHSNWSA